MVQCRVRISRLQSLSSTAGLYLWPDDAIIAFLAAKEKQTISDHAFRERQLTLQEDQASVAKERMELERDKLKLEWAKLELEKKGKEAEIIEKEKKLEAELQEKKMMTNLVGMLVDKLKER
ncbi:hypothetical protein HDU76_008379 [Blyttiomyces sp. JEL0837]|nr:hypothetical protein HDU76_008379 [Blyttiomyces sp. JEL0837]